MYSPTTRLLTVLELLQSYKQISGSELARRLEVDVRTVRRYIVNLQDMGIPVEGERGPYGAYQLQRGYKLPPLMFTDAEAIALTLGLLAIREFNFPVQVAAIEGALAKTERVMPESLFNQARALQEAIIFNVSTESGQLDNDFITPLSLAIREQRQVQMRYQSWSGDMSERAFDPYGIVFNEGFWYTAGYCHLRNDVRTFRLDRIVALLMTHERFERPVDFNVLDKVLDSVVMMPGGNQVEVILKTTLENAQKTIPSHLGTLEETDDGVILRRGTSEMHWIAFFLLSMDFPVQVIQPAELIELLKRMGNRAHEIAAQAR
ncbi:MAG: YafY family transcriptional regulator [Chloroflexi bacterium]|nr:YafY family transcriptional regulator [Chloroflexota bacterium]MCC6891181.1 YafY family transcriptional regulator [Anaerolineae bacterium]